MEIFSLEFLIFVTIVLVIYYICPKSFQWAVLLCANIVFFSFSGVRYLLYIVAAGFVTFFVALQLESLNTLNKTLSAAAEDREQKKSISAEIIRKKRRLCTIGVVFAMGIWIVLKYGNFFIRNINALLFVAHIDNEIGAINLIMPLGISFYTFQAVGYMVDVYRGKYQAERNFFKYFTFVSFFPHIIQGPFSRFDELGATLYQPHSFSYDRLCKGCARILWGLAKKMVIADSLDITVSEIINNYGLYSGTHLIFGMVLYCIQIYADFSGYMDIMCGISIIFGIELEENFNQPYFAKTVDDFWRRWHMTLGRWFRDYVFYPISMGKIAQKMGRWTRKRFGVHLGKLLPGYFALIFVWTATGLWHGAEWKYLIWGYLNLIVIVSTMQMGQTYKKIKDKLHIDSNSWYWNLFCIVRTFCLVCFFRFFSLPAGLKVSVDILKHVVTAFDFNAIFSPIALIPGLSRTAIVVVFFGVLSMLVVDVLRETNRWEQFKLKMPMPVRNIWFAALILMLLLFAGGDNDLMKGFMYANF